MPHGTKIATCSYCGTRAALVLRESGRHELSCASCGAPLHEMKALKAARTRPPERRVQKPAKRRETPKKRGKSRKAGRLWGELFDLIEDVFD